MASAALRPIGTTRCLPPFPKQRTSRSSRSTAPTSSPTASETRRPDPVEELDQRAVAQRPGTCAGCRVDEALRFRRGKGARQASYAARRRDLRGRVVEPDADQLLMPVERAEGGESPGDRRAGKPCRSELGKVAFDRVAVGLFRRGAVESATKVLEVTPVALDRSRGQPRPRQGEEPLDRSVWSVAHELCVRARMRTRSPARACRVQTRASGKSTSAWTTASAPTVIAVSSQNRSG